MQNRVVIITGAEAPVARTIISRFAEADATIVAVFSTIEQAYQLFPPDVKGYFVAADVCNEAEMKDCFEKVARRFGHIDVLVHAVNEWHRQPLEQTDYDTWKRILDINLNSAFLAVKESIKYMKPEIGGRLILLTNAQGADKARSQHAPYAAAHAGLIRLVEATAAEYGKLNITAHAIATSIILTDENGKHGVQSTQLADMCMHLCGESGNALNGALLRAYGTVL